MGFPLPDWIFCIAVNGFLTLLTLSLPRGSLPRALDRVKSISALSAHSAVKGLTNHGSDLWRCRCRCRRAFLKFLMLWLHNEAPVLNSFQSSHFHYKCNKTPNDQQEMIFKCTFRIYILHYITAFNSPRDTLGLLILAQQSFAGKKTICLNLLSMRLYSQLIMLKRSFERCISNARCTRHGLYFSQLSILNHWDQF